jgi:hypothetical protein
MSTLNPIKQSIAIFLCFAHFTANNCMLSEFKHKPIKYHNNNETDRVRRQIVLAMNMGVSLASTALKEEITDIRDITKQEEEWTCFAYAVNKITNEATPLYLYPDHTSNIDIQKLFKQTPTPQRNGLAIYTLSKNDRRIQHCAVVITPEKFESKLGIRSKISHHKPFSVPPSYGNAISYWTLKEKFTTPEGKKKLHKDINKDIYQNLGQQLLLFPIVKGIALGVGLSALLTALLEQGK